MKDLCKDMNFKVKDKKERLITLGEAKNLVEKMIYNQEFKEEMRCLKVFLS